MQKWRRLNAFRFASGDNAVDIAEHMAPLCGVYHAFRSSLWRRNPGTELTGTFPLDGELPVPPDEDEARMTFYVSVEPRLSAHMLFAWRVCSLQVCLHRSSSRGSVHGDPVDGGCIGAIGLQQATPGQVRALLWLNGSAEVPRSLWDWLRDHPSFPRVLEAIYKQFLGWVWRQFIGAYIDHHEGCQPSGRPGNPGLAHHDLIERLALAQQAEEMRARDPARRWKEIASAIHWPQGCDASGVKLLEDARQRLERLSKSDPGNLLLEVAERRKEKKTTP